MPGGATPNPYNGSLQYNYAPKHNPMVYFSDTSGGNNTTTSNTQRLQYAPLQQLQTDLTNNTVSKIQLYHAGPVQRHAHLVDRRVYV